MFNAKILKNNVVTNQARFQTQEEVQQWISSQEAVKAFGEPQWIEKVPATESQAAYQIVHPAEYEIIVEDITAQVAEEQAQIDALKSAQTQAGLRLQAFPAQVDACQDLDALKAAIKQMVQDIAILLN